MIVALAYIYLNMEIRSLNNLSPIVARLHKDIGDLLLYDPPTWFTLYIELPYGYGGILQLNYLS